MPLFISVDLNGDPANAGIVLGLCAAIEIPLMLAFGALASRASLHRLLLVGSLCGTAYCVVVSLATSVWQVAGGAGAARLLRLLRRWAGHHVLPGTDANGAGPAATLFTNTGRLAGMLSGLAFGLVQVHGYRLAYVGSLGLSVTGTAVLAAVARRRRRQARQSAALPTGAA